MSGIQFLIWYRSLSFRQKKFVERLVLELACDDKVDPHITTGDLRKQIVNVLEKVWEGK